MNEYRTLTEIVIFTFFAILKIPILMAGRQTGSSKLMYFKCFSHICQCRWFQWKLMGKYMLIYYKRREIITVGYFIVLGVLGAVDVLFHSITCFL